MKLYEAMFVIDSSLAERDWNGFAAEIEATVRKHGGNLVDLRKWDDRRLAYEIRHMKRAMYGLAHFEAPTSAIEAMRRDFVLSERIVRHLITIDADGVPVGDERPGITNTAIPDFPERRPRDDRPERGRGEEPGVDALEDVIPAEEAGKP